MTTMPGTAADPSGALSFARDPRLDDPSAVLGQPPDRPEKASRNARARRPPRGPRSGVEISTPPADRSPAPPRADADALPEVRIGLWTRPVPPLGQLLQVARVGEWTMSDWARRRRLGWLHTVAAAGRVPAGLVLRCGYGPEAPGWREELPAMGRVWADLADRPAGPRLVLRCGYVLASLGAWACQSAPRFALSSAGIWCWLNWANTNAPALAWAIPDPLTGGYWWSALVGDSGGAVATWAGRVLLGLGALVVLALLWRLGVLRWVWTAVRWLLADNTKSKGGDGE